MNNETRGHAAVQPGLRGHSIGGTFPYTIIGFGDGDFAVFDCRTSQTGQRHFTYQAARIELAGLQLRNLVNG